VWRAWHGGSGPTALEAELIQLNRPENIQLAPDPSVLAVTLSPLQLRAGNDLKRVSITPTTKFVQLRIPLPANDYESYWTELRVNGGAAVFKLRGLQKFAVGQMRVLPLVVPARILSDNDYSLTVSGVNSSGSTEDIGDYPFRVVVAPK
jgi:hypothetical protein